MPYINQVGNNTSNHNDESEVININEIVKAVAKNWVLFVLGVIICLSISIIYAFYSSKTWNVSSKILVEDSKNSPSSVLGGSTGLGADFSSVFNVKSSADNEVQILKSRSLLLSAVEKLQLNVKTYQLTSFGKTIEIYQESPFQVQLQYKADTIIFRRYDVKILNDGHFELSNKDDNIKLTAKLGDQVKLNQYNIRLNPVPNHTLSGNYAITIQSIDAAIEDLNKNYSAGLSDKQSTTIDLGLNYPHAKKGEVILEELMNLYLLSNIQYKVHNADNTISFIDGRINLLGEELSDVEAKFEKYKRDQNIADISAQSKMLVGSLSDYYDKLKQIETQLSIFNDLSRLLNNPDSKSSIPSSMVAPTDISFGQSISAYNQLLIERERAGLAYTSANPIIENYDNQIATARRTLLRTISTYKRNLEISREELQKQNGSLNSKLQEVPAKERGYLDLQRKQNLKQDIYLYLLQKREETSISKTSTVSSSRIIDHAKSEFLPSKPKKIVIYLIGLIAGLVIPSLYLITKELLNVRITSKQDVTKATTVSVAGEIGHNDSQTSLVAVNNSRTIISEQFRSIRTKMNYLLNPSKSNVILFTSSMGGEGKSFLSINLGSSLALTGKKVVFMELDLRKPKLSEIIGHDHNIYGYSNYVISEFPDMGKLIKPTWFDENCALISSGPIPPNPTELLTNKKLETLIDHLKKTFDYVIIDCAPVGLVTDALLIQKFADVVFYVVREGFTYKSQLNIVNDLTRNVEINNLYVIMNDVKQQQAGYSSYGYDLEKQGNWFKKLTSRK